MYQSKRKSGSCLVVWLLAVLRALTASCVLPFRWLLCFHFPVFWLVVGCAVLRLLSVRLLWCSLAPVRAVCLWRFRWVRVPLVLPFLLLFVVRVRVRGVRLLLLLGWVVLFWWLRLWALVLLGLVLSVLVLCLLVLLRAVVLFGWLFLVVFSFVYFGKLNTSVLVLTLLYFL